VTLPVAADGKKTFLWLAGHDGSARVFVNGRPVPYVNAKGEKSDEFVGFCNPGSFDITEALSSSEQTKISILTDRRDMNEVGAGGLIGPLTIYREK
jgi:hypothetical protein